MGTASALRYALQSSALSGSSAGQFVHEEVIGCPALWSGMNASCFSAALRISTAKRCCAALPAQWSAKKHQLVAGAIHLASDRQAGGAVARKGTERSEKAISTIKVSAVISTHNRRTDLARCLVSLRAQNYSPDRYEVIIVDDGSTDGTVEMVRELAARMAVRVLVLQQDRRGPAAARNLGIRHAHGEFVAFLDDDSVPEADWLAEIVAPFDGMSDLGGVSGRRVAGAEAGTLASTIEVSIYASRRSVATNNMVYRKVALDLVGGFDEGFAIPAWEDVDLAARVQDRGYRIVFLDGAVVTHPCEGDWETFRRKGIINGVGLAHFVRKYLFRCPQRALFHLAHELRHLTYFPWWVTGWFGGEKRLGQRLRFARAWYTLLGVLQGCQVPAPTTKDGS